MVTITGGAGATAGCWSHALSASADNAIAATTIKYLMMIILFIEQELSAELRAAVQISVFTAVSASNNTGHFSTWIDKMLPMSLKTFNSHIITSHFVAAAHFYKSWLRTIFCVCSDWRHEQRVSVLR
jgi:hypothetical protein